MTRNEFFALYFLLGSVIMTALASLNARLERLEGSDETTDQEESE